MINLSGEINYAMLETLLKAFKGEHLHIYFSSPEGGLMDVAEAIIDFINTYKDKIEITFYGENFSAGMHIFLRTECKKKVVPSTTGMYHYSWKEITMSQKGVLVNEYDKFSFKEMKISKENDLAFLRTTKLSEKEINGIIKGKDVYFSFNRMKDIIDNAI